MLFIHNDRINKAKKKVNIPTSLYWNQPLVFFLVSDSTPSRARPVPYIELKALWLWLTMTIAAALFIPIETMGAVQDDEPERLSLPMVQTLAACAAGSLHHGVCVCPSRLLRGGKATVLACSSWPPPLLPVFGN